MRLQSYDSTFGLDRTDAFTLTGTAIGTLNFPSQPAVRTFNDNLSYYTAMTRATPSATTRPAGSA